MIVADPFGSWVKGAHEGLSDALAMRQGQDATARSGYDLQRDTQIDPYKAQEAQAKAGLAGLDFRESQDVQPYVVPMTQAKLLREKLGNATAAAGFGDTGYYHTTMQQNGAAETPQGLAYPYIGPDSATHYRVTPEGEISPPGQDREDANHLKFLIQQERVRQAQARIDAATGRTNGGGVLSQHSPFGAGGIPGASPMPAGQQMSPINLNDPSAMYNLHQ